MTTSYKNVILNASMNEKQKSQAINSLKAKRRQMISLIDVPYLTTNPFDITADVLDALKESRER